MKTMGNLNLERTHTTPAVIFNIDGNLKIEGRALPDNAVLLFNPLIEWIDNISCTNIKFEINLEYLNTSSSMHLFTILRMLDENCEIKDIEVIWHYEEDDEDHYDTGLFYEEKLNRIRFSYISITSAEL